jgi:hypothetical protein
MCRRVWLIWSPSFGHVDDVCWDAFLGEAAVVDAVVVVEAQVGVQLASQAGEAGVEVARERGAPALVDDRLWSVSTCPLVWGRPAWMRVWRALSLVTVVVKSP